MSLENFIPEVWSARLLASLHKAMVYAQPGVVNTDYEGEIAAFGDTVRISAIGPVTVADYTKNSDIAAPETLTDAQTALVINQSKYFNFQVDDVDKAQQKPKVMDDAIREAAYALADAADQYVAGLYAEIAAGNWLGSDTTPYVIDNTDSHYWAYDVLVDLSVLLDESNVPSAGRFVVIPPWLYGLLLKDDRFVSYGTDANRATLQNGEIGEAGGFKVLRSNNVPNTAGAKYKVIAGHSMAWSFAYQINKVEAYRPQLRFADAVKGLHLYGAKVVRPTALAVCVASKS